MPALAILSYHLFNHIIWIGARSIQGKNGQPYRRSLRIARINLSNIAGIQECHFTVQNRSGGALRPSQAILRSAPAAPARPAKKQ